METDHITQAADTPSALEISRLIDEAEASPDLDNAKLSELWAMIQPLRDTDPAAFMVLARRIIDLGKRYEESVRVRALFWRRQAVALRSLVKRRRNAARSVSRPVARSRAPRRSPRRRTAKTTLDPGAGDGDPDPDADPIEQAVQRLVATAPPLSAGQTQLLQRLIGGSR